MGNSMILVDNLSIGYESYIVQKGIYFRLKSGEMILVKGDSGCGKTTLLKTLLGHLQPLAGSITFYLDGSPQNGTPLNNPEIGRRVAFLAQQSSIILNLSALKNVLIGCLSDGRKLPFFKTKEKDEALVLLNQLGIANVKKLAGEYSGGQIRRIEYARILMQKAWIVFADEPTSGLDNRSARELFMLTKNFLLENGIAVILSTHDMNNSKEHINGIVDLDNL